MSLDTICLVDPDTINLFDADTIYLDCPTPGGGATRLVLGRRRAIAPRSHGIRVGAAS